MDLGELGKTMNTYSQAGQDRFVHAITKGLTTGSFIDIGCGDPEDLSNTYALEQLGWRGLLIDISPDVGPRVQAKRASPFVCANAMTIDWHEVLTKHPLPRLPATVDYLSFDLDEMGARAFERMPWTTHRFRVLTVEHDAYRFGDGPRQAMRATLRRLGYDLLCPNVSNLRADLEFEDWWVDPGSVDMAVANRFRRTRSALWTEILA